MQQPNTTTSVSLQPTLIELRGPSGKCYGELDTATGVIIFRRGKLPAEHIDLKPYFKAATTKDHDSR
jgi:hypothetical protein